MNKFKVMQNSKHWSSSLNKNATDIYACILKIIKDTSNLNEVITITIENNNN